MCTNSVRKCTVPYMPEGNEDKSTFNGGQKKNCTKEAINNSNNNEAV